MSLHKIGILRGGGTGNQLSDIFKKILTFIIEKENEQREKKKLPKIEIEFKEDENKSSGNTSFYTYHSYKTLVEAVGNQNGEAFQKASHEDATQLINMVTQWHKEGVRVFFRTSINAESLYLYRQKLKIVKEITFQTLTGMKILIIRDQAEGFYANQEYSLNNNSLSFSGIYTKAHQQQLAQYAIKRAKELFEKSFETWAIYKFHLFGDYLEKWFKEVKSRIKVFQPDNGLTTLLNEYIYARDTKKHLLVICSNEVGDFIYEAIMGALNIDAKLHLYTRNILLESPFNGKMKEYQTVHGSADDIADTQKVMPYATLRIVGEIAERTIGIPKMASLIDDAITVSKQKSLKTTDKIVNCVKTFVKRHYLTQK